MLEKQRVVLCVLDGWGEAVPSQHNSISQALTPTWERFRKQYPFATLETSGCAVGLPEGQMGNSEVGHVTLGAGRIFLQDLPRISQSIKDGSLAKNPVLLKFIADCQRGTGNCHLLGLLSSGGVHSHLEHITAVCGIFAQAGLFVHVHGFLDGRDCPPQSALDYVAQFLHDMAPYQDRVRLATLGGRYFGMDRDKRWERIQHAYDAIVRGRGVACRHDALEEIKAAYRAGITDEFIEPMVFEEYQGIRDGDSLFMANFRADRVIQILSALLLPDFTAVDREGDITIGPRASFTEYSAVLTPHLPALFPPKEPKQGLGDVVASHGLLQLRLAETEKYAHVTYFFNGGREEPYPGEERILVPSPKVASYDLQPEMSAPEITDRLIEAIASKKYALIVVNYANADMVGHTGNIKATVKAIECLDQCLARVEEALCAHKATMLVTADHGNAEEMFDTAGNVPHTAHTTNVVPAILVNPPNGYSLSSGELQDVAPTVLQLLQVPTPPIMTGRSLLRG